MYVCSIYSLYLDDDVCDDDDDDDFRYSVCICWYNNSFSIISNLLLCNLTVLQSELIRASLRKYK